MSSQIESQNIDKTFPVAGQDNNSQGFRDNFDAIQRNFEFAKTEIEDLQTKAVLKSPLGSTGVATNDLGGSNISNGNYTNFHGTAYSQTVGESANIDIQNGSLQSFTLTDDSIFTFTNWPDSGNFAKVRVHFINNGSIITVGNDIVVGKRYTIDQVGTTNFAAMGASPSAVFQGSITSSTLNVSSKTSGTLEVGTTISGTGVTPGTKISATKTQNPSLTGEGGTGTYTVDIPQSVTSTAMTGMISGVIFTAITQGSGSGTVKPWKSATLNTEGTGIVIPDAEFNLPLEINPDGSNQVIDAWTWTGSTTKKVYIDYVGSLGEGQANYSRLNIGSIAVGDQTDSTTIDTGSVTVAGGVGVTKNLNVGGSVVIDGNLFVTGNTTLTTSSVTIADIGDITNVVITDPIVGDTLKFDGENWTNDVDLIEYDVRVDDNGSGTQEVFFLNTIALSTNDGIQETYLKFEIGKKYRFNLDDPTNAAAPLRFSTTPDIAVPASITPYTDNVIVGDSYVEILITPETPSPLYLYGLESDPSLDTSLIGAALPIQVGDGPVLVVKDYTPRSSQNILVDTSSGEVTITLPVNSSESPLTPGTYITITDNGNAGTNNVIIAPGGPTVTINSVLGNQRLAGDYASATFVTDGINWTMINNGYNGSEDVANSGTISLSTTVSYFTTETIETASLGDGREGQVKVLTMRGNGGGAMTVTVSNAGWKISSSGNIKFDRVGDACTLQFFSGKWWVISNQGCELDYIPAEIVSVPATNSSSGKQGQLAYSDSHLYVCVVDNTWKRVELTTWS